MLYRRAGLTRPVVCSLLAAIVLVGCSTTKYKQSADDEVYRTLAEKVPAVPGVVDDFDIESEREMDLSGYPVNEDIYALFDGEPPDGEIGTELRDLMEAEVGARIITLDQAQELAFKYSREYQSQKEILYLQALSLTLDRYEFQPMFSAGASAEYVYTSQDESVAGGLSVGVDRFLRTGGRFAIDLTTNLFRFISGGPSQESATTTLVASFQQPLLRGRGKVATEFLTQGERDLLYQMRDFTLFRQDFSVRVASAYYRVLQNRDSVYNEYRGLTSTAFSLRREEAFMEVGLKTPGEVGQLRQNFLSRDASLTNRVISYRNSIDDFKILLGLPVRVNLMLDDNELIVLGERGLMEPSMNLDRAVDVALATRLDLSTQEDQIYDAERRIEVAANLLGTDLDFFASARVDSRDGNRFASLDFGDAEWTAGLDLDLPVNRKAERNNYRRSLINLEVVTRNYNLATDQIILQVRDDWRALETTRKDYEISLLSLELSQNRVEEEEIKSELGQGIIRDLVEAQDALTAAQTSTTGSVINYTIALLNLWRDIGILYIKPNGQWEEIGNV